MKIELKSGLHTYNLENLGQVEIDTYFADDVGERCIKATFVPTIFIDEKSINTIKFSGPGDSYNLTSDITLFVHGINQEV